MNLAFLGAPETRQIGKRSASGLVAWVVVIAQHPRLPKHRALAVLHGVLGTPRVGKPNARGLVAWDALIVW